MQDDAKQAGVFVGGGGEGYSVPQLLRLDYGNRHGLIAGATGTGKTVTLQVLAQGFADAGVPVFMSDVKGDLSGLAQPGSADHKLHDAFMKRAGTIGLDLDYWAPPVVLWDLFGRQGHPIRTTVTEMGPLLLSRLLNLTEAQEGVINIAFRIADDEGLPLLDLEDLRAMLIWLGENAQEVGLRYGNVSSQSIGAIQRKLLVLENQGGAKLFGEPALDLADMMAVDPATGQGRVNILASDELMQAPDLYATFLLWLLSELFEELPEVGNPDKPVFVLFFDEAHLLFDDTPKPLLDKIEQVARLIRSKGVGVYFVTQNPDDVPRDVLGQLGNRVQHALRAFTAEDQQQLRRAAQTYRLNPDLDIEEAIRQVGTGEAVTSLLEDGGVPGMAQRTLIRPPSSRLGPLSDAERRAQIAGSPLAGKYDALVDRNSAAEMLQARSAAAAKAAADAEAQEEAEADLGLREFKQARRYEAPRVGRSTSRKRKDEESFGGQMAEMVMKELTGTTGRRIVRGVLGSLFKGR
ncbi:MAG: ATP-binding protein [Rhodobacterales bacterium]|nr:MAG: ATP-binding protein [Rhodobacterales bacterium]